MQTTSEVQHNDGSRARRLLILELNDFLATTGRQILLPDASDEQIATAQRLRIQHENSPVEALIACAELELPGVPRKAAEALAQRLAAKQRASEEADLAEEEALAAQRRLDSAREAVAAARNQLKTAREVHEWQRQRLAHLLAPDAAAESFCNVSSVVHGTVAVFDHYHARAVLTAAVEDWPHVEATLTHRIEVIEQQIASLERQYV